MRKYLKASNIIIIAICTFVIVLFGILIWNNSQPLTEITFELSELTDNIYAYKETVVSSIPAYNYTIITICDKDGHEHTIKGSVRIVYKDIKAPFAVVKYYSTVYDDEITLYVPVGTVQYLGTSTAGRK